MSVKGLVRRIHLWTGLLLGLPLLFFLATGAGLAWLSADFAKGEHARFVAPPPELPAQNYASPGGVIAQSEGALTVELRHFLGRPVYMVDSVGGVALFDARSGEKLSPLDEKFIREAAKSDYIGEGELTDLRQLTLLPEEFAGPNPVWRAQFNDRLNTRLYISRDTGEVLARRNDASKYYEGFWRLHALGAGGGDIAGAWAVRAVSASVIVFALSGFVMLAFRPGRRAISDDFSMIAQALGPRPPKK